MHWNLLLDNALKPIALFAGQRTQTHCTILLGDALGPFYNGLKCYVIRQTGLQQPLKFFSGLLFGEMLHWRAFIYVQIYTYYNIYYPLNCDFTLYTFHAALYVHCTKVYMYCGSALDWSYTSAKIGSSLTPVDKGWQTPNH